MVLCGLAAPFAENPLEMAPRAHEMLRHPLVLGHPEEVLYRVQGVTYIVSEGEFIHSVLPP